MAKRKTTEQFIEEARKVHGNKYDYSKVRYHNTYTKIVIICPDHGEFETRPHEHLMGYNCPKCSHDKRRLVGFEEKAKEVHGDKYDYSKSVYSKYHTPLIITCPKHGDFKQKPAKHLKGQGCPKCKNEKLRNCNSIKLTKEEILRRFRKIHGYKYEYIFDDYKNGKSKIKIICPIHGIFEQAVFYHLSGCGCRQCADDKNRKSQEQFIEDTRKIHGDKYDYSKVEYKNTYTKVTIICPDHGEFEISPKDLLEGKGCPHCQNRYITTEQFIKMAQNIHGKRFDYSKTEYKGNNRNKVCIICPDHGEFWQSPNIHLRGSICPECANKYKENEIKIMKLLNHNFPEGKFIRKWKNFEILGRKEIDIYSPIYKIGIEYQGDQHFKPIAFFGGEERFKTQVERDISKINDCKNNNITLFHFTYNTDYCKDDIDYEVITDENILIEKIRESI